MEILSLALKRLIALCVMVSVSETLLPSGPLKGCVRLISGLLIAQTVLTIIFSIPGALSA